MTEQKTGKENFVFESLGSKSKQGLLDELYQRLLAELDSGTTQLIIKVEDEVLIGKLSGVSERGRPRYAREI